MPYHPQSANRLAERIRAVVRAALARADVRHALVAASGGADSTCLAHVVATVARSTGRRVTLCHVRHGVRMDDGRDADAARALAARLHVTCDIVALQFPGADGGWPATEATLRDARYAALAEVAHERHADAVLTGHTLDDQAETVLLHLLRGAGVDGLGGMAEETLLPVRRGTGQDAGSIQSLRLVRPLLSVRRDETTAYCAANGLAVVDDPTNNDQRYTRNWLRHTILPAIRERNADVTMILARAATTIRDDAAFLSEETMKALARCDCRTEPSLASISRAAFMAEHPALQRRILRELLRRQRDVTPRADDLEAIRHHAATGRSSTIRHFGGVACCLSFGRFVFGHNDRVVGWLRAAASRRYPLFQGTHIVRGETTVSFTLSDTPVTAYDLRIMATSHRAHHQQGNNAVAVSLRLPDGQTAVIRNRMPGDRFWPSGAGRPLLLRDFLNASNVPAPVRDLLPLLVVNDTIAWVIGHAVAHEFAATDAMATHRAVLTRRDDEQRKDRGRDDEGEAAGTGDGEYANHGPARGGGHPSEGS